MKYVKISNIFIIHCAMYVINFLCMCYNQGPDFNAKLIFFWLILYNTFQVHSLFHKTRTSTVKLLFLAFFGNFVSFTTYLYNRRPSVADLIRFLGDGGQYPFGTKNKLLTIYPLKSIPREKHVFSYVSKILISISFISLSGNKNSLMILIRLFLCVIEYFL